MKEKILEVTHIAIGANISAAIAKRIGRASLTLLGGAFREKRRSLLFQPWNHLLRHTVLHHLEETIFFTCFHHYFRQLRPLQWKVDRRNSHTLCFLASYHHGSWTRRNHCYNMSVCYFDPRGIYVNGLYIENWYNSGEGCGFLVAERWHHISPIYTWHVRGGKGENEEKEKEVLFKFLFFLLKAIKLLRAGAGARWGMVIKWQFYI